MNTLLIVDDDEHLRYSFKRMLESQKYIIAEAESGEEALTIVDSRPPDLIIMDIRMSGMDGLETFRRLKLTHSKIPVIIMTAFGTVDTAIEAMKLGAFEYLLKPFDIAEMKNTIRRALEAYLLMKKEVKYLEANTTMAPEIDHIIGGSSQMQEVYKTIGRISQSDVTVLVRGENGTGKELVARAIYQHSKRSDKPFSAINCAAIPETLLESELFGYEKGAFTGAETTKIGRFERFQNGTILLDEIGDMTLSTQAKVLRILQDGTFERLGSTKTNRADVRIIAATNKDLEEKIKKELFREDLFYRISAVTIQLPPLRERTEDIPEFATYFLAKFSRQFDKYFSKISNEAIEKLQHHHWPGNIRELENTIKRAILLGTGQIILPQHILFENVERKGVAALSSTKEWEDTVTEFAALSLQMAKQNRELSINDSIEEILTREALTLTKGNKSHAAKLLGITRHVLRKRIQNYNLGFPDASPPTE
ncbi:MAG: sigma-54-dependent Fis family transcriptional regulator [Chitinivibrionales bacterium]|nr:sigma-54-dependent Fis family transcriptional regulator [Chitinivibrionales bacterium]